MMNFEKLLFFSKSQMSPICNALPTPPPTHHQQPFMPAQTQVTATTTATATTNSTQFLTPPDAYDNGYADNFDLSLLPNEESDFELNCFSSSSAHTSQNISLDYIPTTVYQHTTNNTNTQAPEIKIEQNWSNNSELNSTNEQIQLQQKQEQPQSPAVIFEQLQQKRHQKVQRTKSAPLEIPPPPYPHQHHHHHQQPHPYPSPESSPTQSDYSFHSRYGSSYSSSYSGSYSSSSLSSSFSSRGSFFPASPCSSFERTHIKQEFHILPPSPPESSCEALSPHCFTEIKTEPLETVPLDAEVEKLIDINSLLESSSAYQHYEQPNTNITEFPEELEVKPDLGLSHSQDHQLLREYLEDTSFQKKHNLKPLALESLIGGLDARGDIEPVISLALEHAKREAEETCAKLQISPDPKTWSNTQVHAWLRSTIEQFKLLPIADLELKFPEDGATLALLTEEEFVRKVPEIGSTIHAQLEIWKLAYSNGFEDDFATMSGMQSDAAAAQTQMQHDGGQAGWQADCRPKIEMDVDEVASGDDDDDGSPPTSVLAVSSQACSTSLATTSVSGSSTVAIVKPLGATPARNGGSHIHLWQFLKELLAAPHINGTAIRWIERSKGVFKIEDSVRVAKLWGRRKNRPAMNYDKLSRSIRQYYKKGIMKKTERSQRLVYQFCHPYNL